MIETVGLANESPPLNRQERRKQATRQQLMQATRELVIEKGVAALRIAEITDRADVGRGSFYNYFETKEELLAALATETIEELADAVMAELPDEKDPAALASIADRRFIRLASSDPEFARLLINLDQGDDLFTMATAPYAREVLGGGLESGRFSMQDPEVFFAILAGSAFALIRAILSGHAPKDADSAHAEAILRLLGIPGDEAREISRRPLPKARSTRRVS